MLDRHEQVLMKHLEDVIDAGCTVITKAELLRWYDKRRLMKSVWKDLHDRWISLDHEVPLLVGEGEGFFALIFGKGLNPSDQSWFKDIREFADI